MPFQDETLPLLSFLVEIAHKAPSKHTKAERDLLDRIEGVLPTVTSNLSYVEQATTALDDIERDDAAEPREQFSYSYRRGLVETLDTILHLRTVLPPLCPSERVEIDDIKTIVAAED